MAKAKKSKKKVAVKKRKPIVRRMWLSTQRTTGDGKLVPGYYYLSTGKPTLERRLRYVRNENGNEVEVRYEDPVMPDDGIQYNFCPHDAEKFGFRPAFKPIRVLITIKEV